MKSRDFLFSAMGIIVGLLIAWGLCVTCNMPIDCCSSSEPDPDPAYTDTSAGGRISTNDALSAMSDYESGYLSDAQKEITGVKGGSISMDTLAALLRTCDREHRTIRFRYGLSGEVGSASNPPKIFLMLSSGKLYESSNEKPVFINTGTAFCPTQCSD